MVTAYFPEGRETAEKIDKIFGDKPGDPPYYDCYLLRPAVRLKCELDSHSLQLETKLSRPFLSNRR